MAQVVLQTELLAAAGAHAGLEHHVAAAPGAFGGEHGRIRTRQHLVDFAVVGVEGDAEGCRKIAIRCPSIS